MFIPIKSQKDLNRITPGILLKKQNKYTSYGLIIRETKESSTTRKGFIVEWYIKKKKRKSWITPKDLLNCKFYSYFWDGTLDKNNLLNNN